MRFLHFILSHSIFIAFCAMGLCYQTSLILHTQNNTNLYGFVFSSTICSYNFYWLLSKLYFTRKVDSTLFIKSHLSFLLLFVIALFGTIYFLSKVFFLLPYVVIGIFFTLLYSLPLWPF